MTSAEFGGGFQAGGDEFRFDVHHARDRLVAVIRSDDKQDVVSRGAPAIHCGNRHAGVAISLEQNGEMFG